MCSSDLLFSLEAAKDGLRRMLWGFAIKLIIADNLAQFVDEQFKNPASASGAQLVLALYFFAIQIYCDFAGYSHIACGCARLLGFELMENFKRPYFARSVTEFWRRWHVSLSTWFRDYVYIPLGGSRASPTRVALNLLATFGLSGLWHGANWTFLCWGLLNGALMIPNLHGNGRPSKAPPAEPSWRDLGKILITFHGILAGWLLFRASSLSEAAQIAAKIVRETHWAEVAQTAWPLKCAIIAL